MDFTKGKIIFDGEETVMNSSVPYFKEYNGATRVAILMKRTPDLLFTIFECLKKHITFIPIDPTYPKEHIQYIIDDSKPDAIISDVDMDINCTKHDQTTTDEIDIAYILYTSGSTGNPKGVEIHRSALFNFIEGVSEIIDFSEGKRIACLTTVSFDIFLLESVMAIYKGLTVVLADENEQRNPKLMAKLIQENMVNMIQMTPSRMQLLLNYDKELSCLKSIQDIMIGGEPFPLSLLHILQNKTDARIYNMYGPTETTVWSTISDLTHKNRIDIGNPIKNTEIFLIDENLCIVPKEQAGEICIAGKGLAKGYIGRKDLTKEKFIYINQNPKIRVYRTGDIGRLLQNGDLEYLGRYDNQVKIRGHRIELEEIEKHLGIFDGVIQSIVTVIEKTNTNKFLEAFYMSDKAIPQKEITAYLSQKLPEYMIPVRFKRIKAFIYTANGKIDRNRISECIEMELDDFTKDINIDEINDIHKEIIEIVESTLDFKISDMKLETEFSEIEIDSITFIRIVTILEDNFDFEFDDEMLLLNTFPTIKSMIDYVKSKIS